VISPLQSNIAASWIGSRLNCVRHPDLAWSDELQSLKAEADAAIKASRPSVSRLLNNTANVSLPQRLCSLLPASTRLAMVTYLRPASRHDDSLGREYPAHLTSKGAWED
jgi:hypothetical protein